MRIALLLLLLVISAIGADKGDGYIPLTNGWWTIKTNLDYTDYRGTNFMTITNPYLYMNGTVIIRVSDREWNLLTNHYSNAIKTNHIKFYSK